MKKPKFFPLKSNKLVAGAALLCAVLIGSFYSCTNNGETGALNDIENKGVETFTNVVGQQLNDRFTSMIKKQLFSINPEEDEEFVTDQGMVVKIPKNSLVFEDGSPVKGKVDVNVKEYYSNSEILLSGIPMFYADAKTGERQNLESDGMFTIEAEQSGKKVAIANGKQIQCTTVRGKGGEGFEFYQMDEDKTWVKKEDTKIEVVKIPEILPVLMEPARPAIVNPVKFNPNFFTIEGDDRFIDVNLEKNQNYDMVAQLNLDVNEHPWLLDRSRWRREKRNNRIKYQPDPKEKSYKYIKYNIVQAIRGVKKYNELKAISDQYKSDLKAYKENYAAREEAGQLTPAEMQQDVSEGSAPGFGTTLNNGATWAVPFMPRQDLFISKFATYNIDRYCRMNVQSVVEKGYVSLIGDEMVLFDRIFLIAKSKEKNGEIVLVDLRAYPGHMKFSTEEENALIAFKDEIAYAWDKNAFEENIAEQLENPQFTIELNPIGAENVDEFDQTVEDLML